MFYLLSYYCFNEYGGIVNRNYETIAYSLNQAENNLLSEISSAWDINLVNRGYK